MDAKKEKKYKERVVYEYLKNSIISGKLRPEKPLVEQEICEQLNVSRTPVREALRHLISEGLVDFSPGKGAAVANISQERAKQMYEMKGALEGMAARLCAIRGTERTLARLQESADRQRQFYEEGQVSMAVDEDLHFHMILLEEAGNPLLEQAGKALLSQARRLSQLAVYDTDQGAQFVKQHEAVINAIKAKNQDDAYRAILNHIKYIESFQWKRWNMLF